MIKRSRFSEMRERRERWERAFNLRASTDESLVSRGNSLDVGAFVVEAMAMYVAAAAAAAATAFPPRDGGELPSLARCTCVERAASLRQRPRRPPAYVNQSPA